MTLQESILKKLATRNILTLTTSSVFLAVIVYVVTQNSSVTENPVIMLLLGQFSTVVGMVYIFYYRKTKTKSEAE